MTDAPSGREARHGASAPPGASGARAARPSADTARSRSHPVPEVSARTRRRGPFALAWTCSEHTSCMTDLFADAARQRLPSVAPLALRLRPQTLDEFVGQEHVLGPSS